MSAVTALCRWRLVVAAHVVRDRDLARLVVLGAFLLVCAGVMIAEYHLLVRSFQTIAELGVAGPPLTLFAVEGFFVLVLVIGVLSTVATGSAVFFRTAENRLLLSAPVSIRALFVLRSLETAALTSWAFVVVAAPALGALGVTYHRAAGFYLVGALLLLGLLVFAGSLGTLLTMALGTLLGHFRSRLGIVGLTVALLVVAGLLVGGSVVPTRADLAIMFEPGMLNGTTVAMHFVEERFAPWPTHAFAAALFGLATREGSHPGRAFVWSAVLPFGALVGAYWAGGALFRRLIASAVEGMLVTRSHGPPLPAHGAAAFPNLLRGPIGALIEKEVVTLARSPEEVGRGAFIAFLLLLYTVFFLRVPVPPVAGTEIALARLIALSVLAAGYFLTTLALRFVYPALSLEGRAVWILLASPVRLPVLLGAKLTLYSAMGFLGLGGIALVGGWRLGLPPAGLGLFGALLAMMSVTIVAVALALGVSWPDFRGQPAEALATSGGGLLTTGLCLGYVALSAWAGYRLVLAQLTGAPTGRVALPLGEVLGLSLMVAAGPLLLARRRLAAFDVA